MSSSCPWPLVFAFDRSAETLHSTVIDGDKALVAFVDLENFQHWKHKAEPVVATDPAPVLPDWRMLATAGGNKKLAVMYHDPPDKWRVIQFDLAGVIRQLEKAID
jgi:hypothetical protein